MKKIGENIFSLFAAKVMHCKNVVPASVQVVTLLVHRLSFFWLCEDMFQSLASVWHWHQEWLQSWNSSMASGEPFFLLVLILHFWSHWSLFLSYLRGLSFFSLIICVGQDSAPLYLHTVLGMLFIHGFTTCMLISPGFLLSGRPAFLTASWISTRCPHSSKIPHVLS